MNNFTDWEIAGFSLLFLLVFIYWVNSRCVKANKTNWSNTWLNRLDGLNRLFCVTYHRLSLEPLALPEHGGVIVISNHISGLDPLLLIAAARRPLRFMMARDEYDRFGLNWLFKAIGCIPVERNGRPDSALREAIRALFDGEVIVLFPYGGIHTDENALPKFKGGAVFLAKKTNCIVYPMRLDGIAGRGHTILAVPMRSHARLQQFKPVSCDALENKECVVMLDNILRNHDVENTVP